MFASFSLFYQLIFAFARSIITSGICRIAVFIAEALLVNNQKKALEIKC